MEYRYNLQVLIQSLEVLNSSTANKFLLNYPFVVLIAILRNITLLF